MFQKLSEKPEKLIHQIPASSYLKRLRNGNKLKSLIDRHNHWNLPLKQGKNFRHVGTWFGVLWPDAHNMKRPYRSPWTELDLILCFLYTKWLDTKEDKLTVSQNGVYKTLSCVLRNILFKHLYYIACVYLITLTMSKIKWATIAEGPGCCLQFYVLLTLVNFVWVKWCISFTIFTVKKHFFRLDRHFLSSSHIIKLSILTYSVFTAVNFPIFPLFTFENPNMQVFPLPNE